MFSASAAFFDELYSFRNFDDEARSALAIARRAAGIDVRSVLDVGCATGDHAAAIARAGVTDVLGIDLDRRLISRARQKHSRLKFRVAEMSTMRLGRRFDAIISLYGVIAYTRTIARLAAASRVIARHLEPGGVAVIQPWHLREHYVASPTARVVDLPHVQIARASAASVRANVVDLRVAYVVAKGGSARVCSESHRVGLFSSREHRDAFTSAGLRVRWVADGPGGHRGVFIAVKART